MCKFSRHQLYRITTFSDLQFVLSRDVTHGDEGTVPDAGDGFKSVTFADVDIWGGGFG